MSTFSSVTPNLIVKDIDSSAAFYRDVLRFSVKLTVPDQAPFAFVWLERDGVPVFLNARAAVEEDYPGAASRPAGGTATLFFTVTDVDGLRAEVGDRAPLVMELKTQFYGMREFAVTDPDDHLITFAQRVAE